ncbi:hypothetical protein [Candidatus Jidaibacter acanthamoebae]|uniref:hypothetical protein n=1 Tax=Candidatus Jidaibacter acanthamoebae TaxID=86105 RepID=UPI00126A3A03|nr:hypothetical protein [Candidatus Jidaibacter acanthamoeba]
MGTTLINGYTGDFCDNIGTEYELIEAVLYPSYLRIHSEVKAVHNLKSIKNLDRAFSLISLSFRSIATRA